MNLTRGINLTKIAEKMNGCSGAELKGVCTEAGMYALRERRVHVTQEVSHVLIMFCCPISSAQSVETSREGAYVFFLGPESLTPTFSLEFQDSLLTRSRISI